MNWLENEKKKDLIEIENSKKQIINQIRSLNKEDLFQKPKKSNIWQKIVRMILGN